MQENFRYFLFQVKIFGLRKFLKNQNSFKITTWYLFHSVINFTSPPPLTVYISLSFFFLQREKGSGIQSFGSFVFRLLFFPFSLDKNFKLTPERRINHRINTKLLLNNFVAITIYHWSGRVRGGSRRQREAEESQGSCERLINFR